MSRQPENTFIASVSRLIPVDLYRMKNHNQYVGGIADVWYSGKAKDLWVEYKFISVPKKDITLIDLVSGNNPDISHLQQDWLRCRHSEGRNVAVIVGCKEGGVWLPKLAWANPLNTAAFRVKIQSRAELAEIITSFVS